MKRRLLPVAAALAATAALLLTACGSGDGKSGVNEAQDLPDGEFGAEQNVIVQEIQAVDR
ncbi:hypothetical protein ACLQ18_38650 [Streptomyces sp. DT193]|uniref:hypothetical protein n=1 Tax=Streptomyces sp. DT193 TaxID=3393418 RepID=UPI003CE720D6